MLTKRMYQVLQFIATFTKEHGFAPSFDEIGEGVGLRSKSNVYRCVDRLEERGFIRRLRGRWRAIEVVRESLDVARAEFDRMPLPANLDAMKAALRHEVRQIMDEP